MGSLLKDKERLFNAARGRHKTGRSWQLLFVDDRGKIVSHVWFKKTAAIILGALLFSVACSIILGFFFIENRNEMTVLKERLDASEPRMKALQNERDVLLARLVQVESKIKAEPAGEQVLEQVPAVSEKSVKPDETAGKKSAGPDNSAGETNAGTKIARKKQEEPEKNVLELDVKDFSASYLPDLNDELKFQFVIRNMSKTVKTVSGYIFVVVKPYGSDENSQKEWLIIPSAEFSEGKPVDAAKGKFFRISRFKTIHLSMNRRISPERYKTAAVFVFNREGVKQFEKSFPFMIEAAASDRQPQNSPVSGAQGVLKGRVSPEAQPKAAAGQKAVTRKAAGKKPE